MDHSNNYYGEEPYFGNGNSSSSSSSRKGKKSNSNSDHNNNNKARKQPQRGLGVAQLEKIRLHSHQLQPPYHPPPPNYYNYHPSHFNYNEDPRVQMSYSPNSYAFQPQSTMMGLPEYERTNNIRYEDSQPRWQHANVILENQSHSQTNITQPFLNLYDSQDIDMMKKHRSGSLDSQTSDTQELDLELRLSLY
ncbi:Protein SPEAR3 [Trifolium repens]|nr:Protein SPEAR3 [Trifolium repens]